MHVKVNLKVCKYTEHLLLFYFKLSDCFMKNIKNLVFLLAFFISLSFADTTINFNTEVAKKIQNLEKSFDGKIGVYAINTDNNQIIAYRADELFPFQSTMKLIGVSALLKQSNNDKNLLQETIHYTKNDLIFWHPVTGNYVDKGMPLKALAEAAITYSDNPAINLIIKKLGGPDSIKRFANSIGNKTFKLKHYESNLNSDPKNTDDTSTPKDMALSLQKLTLGNVLTQPERSELITWMRNNTAGYKRIRAGVPIGWIVADKTGSGDFGIANDIGIMWSPICKPVVLAIYTVQNEKKATRREDIVATTTSIIFDELAKNDSCFKKLFS